MRADGVGVREVDDAVAIAQHADTRADGRNVRGLEWQVDLVMTRGRKTWGIEVKAAASLTSRDGRGLARLADQCGQDFEQGILFYDGRDMLPLSDKRMLAVPLSELWER